MALTTLSRGLGLVIGVGALIVLAGWTFDLHLVTRVRTDFVAMKVNTAIGFLLLGAGLGLPVAARGGRRGLGVVAAAIGAATLVEYVGGIDLHIDEALVRDPGGGAMPGRMAYTSALGLFMAGVGLGLATVLDRVDLRPRLRAAAATAVEACAVVCALLGFVAAVGYLYRAAPLYRVGAPGAMSVLAAFGLMLAGSALAALVPGGLLPALVRSTGSGGLAARRLLPVAVAVPILFGWLWQLGLARNVYGAEVGLGFYTVANVVALSALVLWAREHLDRAAARERAELDQKKATLAVQRALQEKEILLREVHHRVKNNLQVISSLLNLQMRQVSDGAARLALAESRDRVHSIALVHQKLHQSEGVAAIELGDYIVGLINDLLHVQAREPRPAIAIEGEPLRLPLDLAVPCGLIVNELVTNALKYAFPEGRAGSIKVTVAREADKVLLAIADDGVGLPPEATVGGTRSLGLNLVAMLCDQIDAAIEVDRSAGTRFTLRFAATASP